MAEAVLGILISGRGSNMLAIADSIDAGRIKARIGVVISNQADAKGIEKARDRGLTVYVLPSKGKTRADHELEVFRILKAYGVTLVCLAGYMRLLSDWFVSQFRDSILNIHPSLLPAFPGDHAHRDTLAHGVKVSGCTVHIVNENCDDGPIVVQKTVPVLDGDTEDELSSRILEQEYVAYTEAINLVLSGQYMVVGRRFVKR